MGTKYTDQSTTGLTNYNASPPADDGTAIGTNQVFWSTILTKLTDLLKTTVENVDAAMVAHVDVGPDRKTANYTTVAGDHGKTIIADQSTCNQVTLLTPSSAPDGYTVTIHREWTLTGGSLTMAVGSGDISYQGSYTLPNGSTATFQVDDTKAEYIMLAYCAYNDNV